MKRICYILAATVVFSSSVPGAADGESLLPAELPGGWSLRRVEVPAASREAVAQKVGVPLVKLESCPVTAGKVSFKLNVALAEDEAGAKKLEEKFLAAHGNDESFVLRKGSVTGEITGAPAAMAARLKYLLGWTAPVQRTWRVRLEAAPVLATKNAMQYQPLFETLSKLNGGATGDAAALQQLEKLRGDFTFGDSLHLYAPRGTLFTTTEGTVADGKFTLPVPAAQKRHGVPGVKVEFTRDVREFSRFPAAAPGPALTAETRAWPQNVSAIQELAAGVKALPPAQRLEKVLAWSNERVPYGGKTMGSRYGVAEALKQGHGRCWDASDVFIAACRASGPEANGLKLGCAGVSII